MTTLEKLSISLKYKYIFIIESVSFGAISIRLNCD